MRVEKEIEEPLKGRHDLVRILDAAAEYLASRDTDPETQARARWRLWVGPNGEPRIDLRLEEGDYSAAHTFTPNQLVPADIRELRLIRLWQDVLMALTHRQVAKVEKLLSEYTEDDADGDKD